MEGGFDRMKLVEKKVTVGDDLLPIMTVTMELSMEKIMDEQAIDPNFYAEFGRKFFQALENK
jgi:hypothetical protein